ncbi:hypothetical protein [Saccharopolyspora sp. NPDC002376]
MPMALTCGFHPALLTICRKGISEIRSAKRVIAATALGLPIMFGAPTMAFAGGHENGDDQSQAQDQDATTDQANTNVSPI